MNNLIKTITGMGAMTDQVVATDFLISAKAGVRNLAFAITESSTPEVRDALRLQLKTAIKTHEKISNYMMEKGIYHPHDMKEQLRVDMKISETALSLTELGK